MPLGVPVPTTFVSGQFGGYALGDPVTDTTPVIAGSSSADGGAGCDVLVGVVRDFKGINEPGGHPDFEAFDGKGVTPGLVGALLGTDEKPVYASRCEAAPDKTLCPYGQMTTSQTAFDQWYRNTPGVNLPYLVYLLFQKNGAVYTFASTAFFPLDGAGWGNSPQEKGRHNFGFTTELHTEFVYQGGERSRSPATTTSGSSSTASSRSTSAGCTRPRAQTIDMDGAAAALGIAKGTTTPRALPRRAALDRSHFRVDTNLVFVDCGTIGKDAPPALKGGQGPSSMSPPARGARGEHTAPLERDLAHVPVRSRSARACGLSPCSSPLSRSARACGLSPCSSPALAPLERAD